MSPQAEAFHCESWWGWAQWWSESFPSEGIIFVFNQFINIVTAESSCIAHQPHVIRQYSSTNSRWCFFGTETREAVVVELASLLPEGRQRMFVFTSTHPWQRLLLVGQERRAHSLWREGMSYHTWDNSLPLSPLYKHTYNIYSSPQQLLALHLYFPSSPQRGCQMHFSAKKTPDVFCFKSHVSHHKHRHD